MTFSKGPLAADITARRCSSALWSLGSTDASRWQKVTAMGWINKRNGTLVDDNLGWKGFSVSSSFCSAGFTHWGSVDQIRSHWNDNIGKPVPSRWASLRLAGISCAVWAAALQQPLCIAVRPNLLSKEDEITQGHIVRAQYFHECSSQYC